MTFDIPADLPIDGSILAALGIDPGTVKKDTFSLRWIQGTAIIEYTVFVSVPPEVLSNAMLGVLTQPADPQPQASILRLAEMQKTSEPQTPDHPVTVSTHPDHRG